MHVSELERLRSENTRLHQALARHRPAGGGPCECMDAEIEVVLEKVSIALFGLDAGDRFTRFRAGKMKLAAPPEAFLGRRIDAVFPEPLASLFLDAAARARATGEPVSVEYELTSPDASEGPRHYVAHFAPDAVGGTAVFVKDITERHLAAMAMYESERRFRAMIEKATDILYVLDAGLVVRFWSPGAAEALGWGPEEAIGKFGPDFVHPDDAGQLTLPSADAPPGTEGGRFSYRVRHRDGSWRWLEAVVRNLLADPAIGGVIINARDVTEQRRLEARSAESERLESIGRLAGGVAHDFNNLLTVILSCGELLQESLATGEPIGPDDVTEILAAGMRARDLTQQLLAFARRQVIAPTVLDLNTLVRDTERLLRRVLGTDITLEMDLDRQPCHVRCDPAQLQQVVLNLAVNARDAMPRGGRLQLATARVSVSAELAARLTGVRPGPHIRLSVRDDGTGLAPEVRPHIFEPFFTTKPQGRGTGLGLATVHGIVSQAGGGISVSSEPGNGTLFEIFLPETDEAPLAAPETPQSAPRTGNASILLVEDDPAVGLVTTRILRDAGYTVLHARDGGEALVHARQRPNLDLLLTDVIMPGMDGGQVATAVTRLHPHVAVLFMSGHSRDAVVHRGAVEAGVQFLPKPFAPAVLLQRVSEALGGPDEHL